jgi:hypothetical protein
MSVTTIDIVARIDGTYDGSEVLDLRQSSSRSTILMGRDRRRVALGLVFLSATTTYNI